MRLRSLSIVCTIAILGQFPASSQVREVDPFLGTGGHGHTYPGATVPFGMVQLGPDNGRSGWDWSSGYHHSDSLLAGFSHTHLSGTGIGDLCDILLMPCGPDVPLDGTHRSRFSHGREFAEPGYYAVGLPEESIDVALTATVRAGFHQYTFHSAEPAGILIDLGYAVNWDKTVASRIVVGSDSVVSGWRMSKGWAVDQRVYFVARFSRPILSWRGTVDDVNSVRDTVMEGTAVRARLDFGPMQRKALMVKVGISGVSVEGARRNLEKEIPGWDFPGVRSAAAQSWEQELSTVRVAGGTSSERHIFTTALYHTMLAPVIFSDTDGRYRGGDGAIHSSPTSVHYSIFSLWDTFRAAHPLFTLLQPGRVRDMVSSMVAFGKEHGLLPVWSLLGNETNTMIGYHSVPVLADALLKGFSGVDREEAFALMKKSALQDDRGLAEYRKFGYMPADLGAESVSRTLEYAYDDWCIAQVARLLRRADDATEFLRRADFYRALFDPKSRFMRPRLSDGRWKTPFDPRYSRHEGHDYTEGNAWQYTWFVLHDVAGLIDLMGGAEAFTGRLDSLFEQAPVITGSQASPDISGLIGQYAHGNEPSHHIAYLYNYAGKPWKTQERVSQIRTALYHTGPEGLCGNEDCGQMSAWFVFSAMGFYPVNPAEGVYVLTSPLFPSVVLRLENGRTFTVLAKAASPENVYIQSALLNGAPLKRSYITHREIMQGGILSLDLGPEPNSKWGADPSSYPPSQSGTREQ